MQCDYENKATTRQCNHKDSAVYELWQGDLLKIGNALESVFKNQTGKFAVFRRISNRRNYVDEYLSLTPDDAILWQREIEQLKNFLSGEEFMGWHERKKFESYLLENKLLYGNTDDTLNDGLNLIKASLETGNSIEFDW